MFMPRKILEDKLAQLLAEDIGLGDVTSAVVVPSGCKTDADVVAKSEGIVAGVEETSILAESMGLKVNAKVTDGSTLSKGKIIMRLSGDAATILTLERTLLNLLSRMSGIATATHALVGKIHKARFKTRVTATRKTAVGLLFFDKKAVVVGGGDSHRLHLDDMVLIKDNHIAIAGSLEEAMKRARRNASFSKKIEVEVTSSTDALLAAELGADIVMLDNFSPAKIKKAVALLEKSGFAGKVILEASGGITSENLLDYAAAGVDLVSLGELTHSVKSLDISLEIVKPT